MNPKVQRKVDTHADVFELYDEESEKARKRQMRDLGDLYLVFNFVDTDLSKIIKSDQHMGSAHVQYIMYQILLGIHYVHSANVIHRDIKPANILISCADCGAKVADFGLARVVTEDEVAATTLDTRTRAGTISMDVSGDACTTAESPDAKRDDMNEEKLGLRMSVDHHPFASGHDGVQVADSKVAPTAISATMAATTVLGGLGPAMDTLPPPVPLKRQWTQHVITR